MDRVRRVAWGTLALNLAVTIWGAFVRASGSGAGCGAHWPLCNGQVVPHSPGVETLIELTHRVTSGLATVAVLWLAYEAFRHVPRSTGLRRAAGAAVAFIVMEAAIGASLVLFGLVAQSEAVARAPVMSAHLVNTFLLLGALALAAHFGSGGAKLDLRARPTLTWLWLAGLASLMLAGATGAIAALGDTLYPSKTIADAMAADWSSTAHLLIRLRVLHPVLAITAGVANVLIAHYGARLRPTVPRPGLLLAIDTLVATQVVAGTANVILLAPVWMQLIHLTLADLLWVAVVLHAAQTLAVDPAVVAAQPVPRWRPTPARV